MSIDTLIILGVRSFDNQVEQKLKFNTPLTLIVGYNGAGKTTIIECLKYATTGELPPNSKGGAFIHDPKLCGEKEVMALVQLRFRSSAGMPMTATRRLQLTVKKASRSQKTLEGSLVLRNGPERTSLSTRVAELDQMIPQYLGVSTAILDSVIFCHQDESLWPMSEPSVLKKRFDEIFEALKYTKAIDNIKVLRKKQNEELGKYKIIEQHAKEDKDKGERAERRSEQLANEIEELRRQSDELGQRTKEATHKARDAWDHAAQFEKIVAQLEGKRIEAQALGRSVSELKTHLKEMSDSDEELQSILDQYEERTVLYEQDNKKERERYTELQQELQETRRSLGAKQSEAGKHEAQKDQYERQIRSRETLVKETARQHDIRGFELDVTDEHVRDFMERIGKMARDQNAALERARRETQDELQTVQKALNELHERKSALNQSKENARSQIATNDRRIAGHQSDLDKIEVDEAGKATLESAIEDVEQRLRNAKSASESAQWDSKFQTADARSRDLEDQKEKLDAELIHATQQAGESARLDFLRKELKDRQRGVETMSAAHGSRIAEVVGPQWSPATLERDFQSVVEQKGHEVKDAELQRDGTTRELEQVEFKLSTTRSDLKRKRAELQQSEKVLRDATGEEPSEFPEYLEELEASWSTTKQDTASFQHLEKYYKDCLDTAKSDNVCRLCRRSLRDRDKQSFVTRLEQYVQKAARDAIAEDFETLEADLKKAKAASSTYDTWRRLKSTEIPALVTDEQSLDSRRNTLLAKVEKQDGTVKERQEARRDVESLSRTVQNIAKYHTEMGSFEAQIDELVAKQIGTNTSRGLEKIQEDIKRVTEESRQAKSQQTRLSSDRDTARGQINHLELEARDMRSKLSGAVYQLREKASLVRQIEDLKSLNNEHRESTRTVDRDIESLAPRIDQARVKYDDAAQRGGERERDLQREANKLMSSVQQLKSAEEDINHYIDRGGPQQLMRTRREVERLEGELGRVETEQRHVTVNIKKIEDQLRNHTETQRNIGENLRYRRGVRDLEAVESTIQELDAHNAHSDKDRYEREANKWQLERNTLSAQQASLLGTMKSKDDQLQQLLQDWETEYKDAKYKYKEAHVKVETTKAAVEDLGRYGGALDKAIMRYHSLKMEEINRIVEELWKKTYQGTDVDTILIRSDSDNVKGNKSYNYRVCMVKQDAEMDMRGRCSAGQKVLASIIIRLALAECFGVHCGLIALDEPTTNLDRENIRSLAQSLAEIIRVRRQQANFQLLVITHDEGFLRAMQCEDFCDEYYRVSRDERQKSVIKPHSIADVM